MQSSVHIQLGTVTHCGLPSLCTPLSHLLRLPVVAFSRRRFFFSPGSSPVVSSVWRSPAGTAVTLPLSPLLRATSVTAAAKVVVVAKAVVGGDGGCCGSRSWLMCRTPTETDNAVLSVIMLQKQRKKPAEFHNLLNTTPKGTCF